MSSVGWSRTNTGSPELVASSDKSTLTDVPSDPGHTLLHKPGLSASQGQTDHDKSTIPKRNSDLNSRQRAENFGFSRQADCRGRRSGRTSKPSANRQKVALKADEIVQRFVSQVNTFLTGLSAVTIRLLFSRLPACRWLCVNQRVFGFIRLLPASTPTCPLCFTSITQL